MLDKSSSFAGLITLIDSIGSWPVPLLLDWNVFLVIVKSVDTDMTGRLQAGLYTTRVVYHHFALLLEHWLGCLIWELGYFLLLFLFFKFYQIICYFPIFTYCFWSFLSWGFFGFIIWFLFCLGFDCTVWVVFAL